MTPGPNAASARLHVVKKWHPRKATSTIHEKASDTAEPIKLNLWGGVPCATLADGTTRCFGQPAVPPPSARPKVTPGNIAEATRKIGLPALAINIQPGTATLVNLDTIFYARPQPFARSVTLLGYDIDLVATPARYTWHHGDGTSHSSTNPGAPYPSKAVTYRYQHRANHVSPSVDVTYRVRYRVNAGPWQDLDQTLTANGPAGDLEVKEAGAVLTSH